MLLNLSKKTWTEGLLLQDFESQAASNDKVGAGRLGGCVVLAPPALPVWLGLARAVYLPFHACCLTVLAKRDSAPSKPTTQPPPYTHCTCLQPNCSHTHPGGG